MINYHSVNLPPIKTADGHSFAMVGKGDLKVKLPNGSDHTTMILKDVIYAPNLMFTLISVPHLDKADCLTMLDRGMCLIIVFFM